MPKGTRRRWTDCREGAGAMKKVRAVSHRQVMSRLLKDRQFRRGYEEELEKLRLSDTIIVLRQRQGITQQALAR